MRQIVKIPPEKNHKILLLLEEYNSYLKVLEYFVNLKDSEIRTDILQKKIDEMVQCRDKYELFRLNIAKEYMPQGNWSGYIYHPDISSMEYCDD